MAVINDPNVAANISRIGEVATSSTGAQHISAKPIPTSIGHYRVTHRCALVATQAATSRLFEIRNTSASRLIIPTRLILKWFTLSAHTAFIENSLDVYKGVGFSAVDTVNTVTPVGIIKRTTGMVASNAEIRGVTIAGAAAGMTGATITALANPIAQHPIILPQAVEATTETTPRFPFVGDIFDDVNGTYPFVLEQNEGIVIANRVLLGAAAGSSVYIDFSWVETLAY